MPTSRSTIRRVAALIAASAITALSAGVVAAHPESEGDHPGGCVVTAEPGTVAIGGQFTVSGNFGGASIWVLPGADATIPEGAAPDATSPAGTSSFDIVFTAQGPGELTVVATIPETECGDTDHVTVTGRLPNTAAETPAPSPLLAGLVLIVAGVGLGLGRFAKTISHS